MKQLINGSFVYIGALILFLHFQPCLSQNQSVADSLVAIYNSGNLDDSTELSTLFVICQKLANPDDKIHYANVLLSIARIRDMPYYEQAALLALGAAYTQKGDTQKALGHLFLGVEIAKSNKLNRQLGSFYGQLANVYSLNEDLKNSLIFQKKALKIFKELGEEVSVGYACINIGYYFYELEQYDSAMYYYNMALTELKKENFGLAIAYTIGNRALVELELGKYDSAEYHLNQAINLLEPYGDEFAISDYLVNIGRINFIIGNDEKSLNAILRAIDIAKKLNLREQLRDAYLLLSKLNEKRGLHVKALQNYMEYTTYKDSILNIKNTQKIADLRTQYEVGQKQAEVDLLTAEKRIQKVILIAVGGFALILFILAIIIYKYYQSKARVNKILEDQKRELESLNQTKDKFFSIISHDLRGPVSSFMGISRMIKYLVKSKETEQLLEVADNIDESVERLSSLLDNLLSWAMQQQGHFPNVPEKLHLNEIANDLVKTLSTMAEGKRIELKSTITEDIHLWADKNTTMTILRNLVNNALKFTPEGGSVIIRADHANEYAKIQIIDTGVGIPQDKLNKLFRLEDKKSTYGTSGEKGLGLGLQLVHEFIEMNNGQIKVQSQEGSGTTFEISLPMFENVENPIQSK